MIFVFKPSCGCVFGFTFLERGLNDCECVCGLSGSREPSLQSTLSLLMRYPSWLMSNASPLQLHCLELLKSCSFSRLYATNATAEVQSARQALLYASNGWSLRIPGIVALARRLVYKDFSPHSRVLSPGQRNFVLKRQRLALR